MKTFTREEVAKHNTEESLWMIIDNKVYDLTDFIDEHPGGESVLLDVAGQDASEDFHSIGQHLSSETQGLLEKYLIGVLAK